MSHEPTVGELARLGAVRSPDRVAVRMRQGGAVTYAELDRRSDRLANALLGLGLRPGERIAAWMDDRIEYVELYLAAAKAGLVMVPINARLKRGEAMHPLRDSGARALFWTANLADSPEELEPLDPEPLRVAVGEDAEGPADHRFEDLVAAGAEGAPPPPAAADPFIVGYTSGTTGTPKGAILTHRSVLALARLNAISYRLPLGSVAALTGSMSFVATVPAHVVTHLLVGGTLVIMGRWDAESLLAEIESSRTTFTYLPSPTIPEFTELAARDPRPWSSLRSVLHSASRAEPGKLRALCEVIGERFVEGLGMTENSGGLITATTAADVAGPCEARDIFASVGRPVAESAVELRGPGGERLPRDGETVGELAIRSPALMAGYWNLPEETAKVLVDGWYLSGDLGSIDPAGYVYVAERRTDLIVSGGMNVYPSEVEAHLATMPGVAECAVVGVPHERWGQAVAAAVVRDGSREVAEDEVIAFCREGLAGYKKPTAAVFLDALPRTASLKVKRAELRERLAAHL